MPTNRAANATDQVRAIPGAWMELEMEIAIAAISATGTRIRFGEYDAKANAEAAAAAPTAVSHSPCTSVWPGSTSGRSTPTA